MNYSDLQRYRVNYTLMTKSFLSSSIDRQIAELFLCQKESVQPQTVPSTRKTLDGLSIKTWVMCIYHIKYPRSALHIEDASQYPNEGEILIMPYTVFQVKRINQVKLSDSSDEQFITEIELEECHTHI